MNPGFDLQSSRAGMSSLERAILETLAYSDVFDYPLRLEDLHRFLAIPISIKELAACLDEFDQVGSLDGHYFLKGREHTVSMRLERERLTHRAFGRAIRYGQILGSLPFVRMVALTGSLAMRNCDETGDYDYMLVTKPGRVWLARAFALLLNRLARLSGETICPNLIVSEKSLQWTIRNLYFARELCQMVLITGRSAVGFNLRVANLWVADYFPNFKCTMYQSIRDTNKLFVGIRSIIEFLLSNRLGDRLEEWEMNRKINRLTRQAGFGMETKFNADMCQGNFDHHGSSTMGKYQQRLQQLTLVSDNAPAHDDLLSSNLQEQVS